MKRFVTAYSTGLAISFLFSFAAQADALQINTADKNGAYHKKFCPPVQKALKKAQFDYKCQATQGSRENIDLIGKNGRQLGFSQLDLYALEKTLQGGKQLFHTIRDDIARECLFLVSKDKELKNFGQVAANADKLNFVLPPKKSGHVGTFEYLQQIDPQGLGKASNITYVNNTDEAIDKVLEADGKNTVTLFVQFPDANDKRFKKVPAKGGHFIPVIDRNILRQDINGEKVYFAEDTQVENPQWHKKGTKVITACTPLVLFTGIAKNIEDKTAQKDHKDLIRTLESLPVADLQPEKNFLSKLWNKTKAISATSVEKLMEASEDARKAAKPMVNKAKELGEQAVESSKPLLEKAKKVGNQALDKANELATQAKESAKDMIEKTE